MTSEEVEDLDVGSSSLGVLTTELSLPHPP